MMNIIKLIKPIKNIAARFRLRDEGYWGECYLGQLNGVRYVCHTYTKKVKRYHTQNKARFCMLLDNNARERPNSSTGLLMKSLKKKSRNNILELLIYQRALHNINVNNYTFLNSLLKLRFKRIEITAWDFFDRENKIDKYKCKLTKILRFLKINKQQLIIQN